MNNKLSPFYKTHQPCPDCGSSDALCINEDRSTKCFSCGKFTPKPKNIVPMSNNYTIKQWNNFHKKKCLFSCCVFSESSF